MNLDESKCRRIAGSAHIAFPAFERFDLGFPDSFSRETVTDYFDMKA